MYIKMFDGGMSHNILLHYAIELGLVGLFFFLAIIFYQCYRNYFNWLKSRNLSYLFQLCFLIGILIADLAAQLLYFNKYAYYIFFISASFFHIKNPQPKTN